jgi:membrane-associated phospholipid phosphatase
MGKKKSKAGKAVDALQEADAAVTQAVVPLHATPAVRLVSLLSEIGDQPPMRALCAGVILVGLGRGDARLARAGVRMLAAHSLATGAKNFVKRRIDRTRPRTANGKGGHKMKKGRNTQKEETSFPSGHSAGAAAVAQAFTRDYPEHRTAALAAAGAIALAQIPRCAHYPTDVGSGLAIGFVSEALVGRLIPAADPH